MDRACPKCRGQMDEGRIPFLLKFLSGYKSNKGKHFSLESNIQKARACLDCGYLEFFLNPKEVKSKMK